MFYIKLLNEYNSSKKGGSRLTIINIAKDFSKTPGARYEKFGPFSGQEFRKKFLESLFQDKSDDSEITIILDGVAGYAT